MIVEPTTDQAVWDGFMKEEAGEHSSFLHSWDWLHMQQSYGRPVHRLIVRDGDTIHGIVGLVVFPLSRGFSYLFSPRGPVFRDGDVAAQLDALVQSDAFTEIAHAHRAIFWRVEPSVMPKKVFRHVKDVQPSVTSMISVQQTDQQLLALMKQKTRYNIRLAEKKGVEVEFVSQDGQADWHTMITAWTALLEETSTRHGIRNHPPEYYRHMISTLGEGGRLEIVVARHEGDILAMNLNMSFGDTMTYVHGASTERKRNVMAPYALQWESLRRAREHGYVWYDFYGVAPEGVENHPLAGVTRFKQGFGGKTFVYPGTYEFPILPLWYKIYHTIKRFRSFV